MLDNVNGHDVRAPRVMLATKFPERYAGDTIATKLSAIGIHVERIVPMGYRGEFAGIDAVLFMFQMCSHSECDAFKERAAAAGVKFILLERQAANWPHALRRAGLSFSGKPLVVAPLPKPPAPVAPPVVEFTEMPEPDLPDAPPEKTPPVVATFGAAMRAAREGARLKQEEVATLCDASQTLVCRWEHDERPVPRETYDALVQLFPALATAPAPEIAPLRVRRVRSKNGEGAAVASPVPETLPVIAAPAKAPPAPLAGLLRAARALGIAGKVAIEIDDAATVVLVGAERWQGTTPDEAVEVARHSLDERLGDLLRRVEEARAMLGGAR